MNALSPSQPDCLPASTHVNASLTSIVVCGEVSSGKSSVINLLLRRDIVPDFFGQLERPVIVVRHSETPSAIVKYASGVAVTYETIQSCRDLSNATSCEIYVDAPHLEGVELIEAPFQHDGEVSDGTFTLMGAADILVWVTICSQAWRLTERTIVAKLPKGQRDRSVLVVSRADKLKSVEDNDKIRGRLEAETVDFFKDIVFMKASKRSIKASAKSDVSWANANGEKLAILLEGYVKSVEEDRQKALTADSEPKSSIVEEVVEEIAEEAVEEVVETVSAPVEVAEDENEAPESVAEPIEKIEPVGQPEAPTAAPVTAKASIGNMAELTDYVAKLNGVVRMGAVTLDGEPNSTALSGAEDDVNKTGQVCAESWQLLAQNLGNSSAGGEVEQVTVTLSEHLLLYQASAEGESLRFMMCKAAKINSVIAKKALMRISDVWDHENAQISTPES